VKRRRSKPYIRQRGEGDNTRYFVQIFTGRDAARRPQFIHRTFSDPDDAEAFVLQTLADRKRGAVLPTTGKVAELLDDMLREQEITGRKNLKCARGVVENHLRPYFGNLKIDRLTSAALAEYVLRCKAEGVAPASINNRLAGLRHAFNLGYHATPPKVARVPHFPMLRLNNARQGFFDLAEYEALLLELPADLRPVLCFGFFTGCRRAEVLGLRWSQVDLDRGLIRLERGTTKNDEPRTIPLAPQLWEVLRMQRDMREKYWPRCPWVFFWHASGQPIKSFGGSWSAACKRAGLWEGDEKTGKPTKLFHDLRRSAVRNMERAGVPRKIAMEISGHKTESIYARYNIVAEADLRVAAERLGEYTRQAAVKLPVKPGPQTATVQ
jgi:integrase